MIHDSGCPNDGEQDPVSLLESYSAELADATTDPIWLANMLCSKGIIDKPTKNDILSTNASTNEKSIKLWDRVSTTVKYQADPKKALLRVCEVLRERVPLDSLANRMILQLTPRSQERILPSERGEHHVAANNLPEDNITTEYADLNVHTSVAAGDRANDQLRVYGYRSNYKKMWHIFGSLFFVVAILSNILLEIGRLEDELNYVWICLIPYTYVLLLILGIVKQSKIIISYGMLHIMVFCEFMFLSRLFMLLEWTKVVTWLIQILCKAPFYGLIILDYFQLEMRLYVCTAFLEASFPAIESFLLLIFSNKNTILMFSVIFICLYFLCALGNFQMFNNEADIITFVVFILFFVVNLLFEIVCIFEIMTLSSSSFQSSFFVRKLFLSLARLSFVFSVICLVEFIHKEQLLQNRTERQVLWLSVSTIAIVLYTYYVSYQLNNEVSVTFLLSIFLVCILWILFILNFKAAYAATALIVVFSIYCFFWYKLYAVKLISITVAEFMSQFTMVGALLFAVGYK